MKHLLRWAGFSAGYFGAVLLQRVLTRVEESSRAYELARAEATAETEDFSVSSAAGGPLNRKSSGQEAVVPFVPRARCLCSHCQDARAGEGA